MFDNVTSAAREPRTGAIAERTDRPTAPHALGNRLVLTALATSPLMYVIELVAPFWVIYAFRAAWVLLVAVAAVVVVRDRRRLQSRRP